eukprot:gb/GECG01008130.1/.p1 GENE.gb/GECG01008130.1/~~gb/GECG01008130.1/.p1  ORF type:complete len:485 (+),score=48.74 gb/GECG01008130.1/:1-1455(+)
MDLSDTEELPDTLLEILNELEELSISSERIKNSDQKYLKHLLAHLCEVTDIPDNRVHSDTLFPFILRSQIVPSIVQIFQHGTDIEVMRQASRLGCNLVRHDDVLNRFREKDYIEVMRGLADSSIGKDFHTVKNLMRILARIPCADTMSCIQELDLVNRVADSADEFGTNEHIISSAVTFILNCAKSDPLTRHEPWILKAFLESGLASRVFEMLPKFSGISMDIQEVGDLILRFARIEDSSVTDPKVFVSAADFCLHFLCQARNNRQLFTEAHQKHIGTSLQELAVHSEKVRSHLKERNEILVQVAATLPKASEFIGETLARLIETTEDVQKAKVYLEPINEPAPLLRILELSSEDANTATWCFQKLYAACFSSRNREIVRRKKDVQDIFTLLQAFSLDENFVVAVCEVLWLLCFDTNYAAMLRTEEYLDELDKIRKDHPIQAGRIQQCVSGMHKLSRCTGHPDGNYHGNHHDDSDDGEGRNEVE